MNTLVLSVGLALQLGAQGASSEVRVSPFAPELRFSGRVDRSDARGPRFAWSGTRFEVRFTGGAVRVRLRDLPKIPDLHGRTWPNRFEVTLDDEPPQQVLVGDTSEVLFERAWLSQGPHRLEVYKQTEALVGEAQLLGIELAPGATLLSPEPAQPRRIEFIGDSVTSAYGNEGQDFSCHFTAEAQNHRLSYGALTAQELGAEAVTIALSGRGVIRNMDAPEGALVIPQAWDLTLPAREESRWDFSAWTPEVVVVNLGANDFAGGDPGEKSFEDGYVAFLTRIRARYPKALLVACLGATLSNDWPVGARARTKARRYLQDSVRLRRRQGDSRLFFLEFGPRAPSDGYGCDYHPNLVTHRAMAKQLTARLRQLLGW